MSSTSSNTPSTIVNNANNLIKAVVDLYIDDSVKEHILLKSLVAIETFNIHTLLAQVKNAKTLVDHLMEHVENSKNDQIGLLDGDKPAFIDVNLYRTIMQLQLDTMHIMKELTTYVRNMPAVLQVAATDITNLDKDIQATIQISAGEDDETEYQGTSAARDNMGLIDEIDALMAQRTASLNSELDTPIDLKDIETHVMAGNQVGDYKPGAIPKDQFNEGHIVDDSEPEEITYEEIDEEQEEPEA